MHVRRHEQYAGKGGQPGLSKSRRQHDQPGPVPGSPRGGQRRQRRALYRMGFGWRGRGLVRNDLLRQIGQGCALPPGGIGGNPVRGQRAGPGMGPEVLERAGHHIGGALGMQVPFDGGGQRGPGQVRAADNGRALPVGRPEQPGLRVETPRTSFENPDLRAV